MNERHQRERQIAEILVRHGWGYLWSIGGHGQSPATEHDLAAPAERERPPAPPERLRLALAELGPTFVKVGQLLSTRADLLEPRYRRELAKLQDGAPHLSPEIVRELVTRELGGDVHTVFASFDMEPLAAASIGQAHAATLHSGVDVVVKVQRPGAAAAIEQDLEILQAAAARAERRWEAARRHGVAGLAAEFAQTLRAELDYLREGRNAERFAASFEGDPDVEIPAVFWEATTKRVITLQRVRGLKMTDIEALEAAGIDRHELAGRATRVIAKMVFDDGFFHADPHPGNFFIQPGGRIAIIDFGMVGILSDHLRGQLGKLIVALVLGDAERLVDAVVGLGASSGPVDRGRLRDDLAGLLGRYAGRSLAEVGFGAASADILEVVRRHGIRAPRDLALLLKAFIMDEGMAEELDPEFRIVEALTPYAYRHLLAQVTPTAMLRRAEHVGVDIAELAVDLPGQLHRILDVLAAGKVEVHLRTADVERLLKRSERLGNRIALSIVGAAMISALAGLYAPRARSSRHPQRLAARHGRFR